MAAVDAGREATRGDARLDKACCVNAQCSDRGAPKSPDAAAFGEKGAILLDCPVSGGALTGTSRIFVGGDRDAFERVEPILKVLGHPDHVVYCGPSSSGQAVKAVNQLGMGLVRAAYLEAVAFGIRCRADPAAIARGVGGEEAWRSEITRTVERMSVFD